MLEQTITLTRQLIEAGSTGRAGYTDEQLSFIGLKQPLSKGWIKRCEGKKVPAKDYKMFLELSTYKQAMKILQGQNPAKFSKRAKRLAAKIFKKEQRLLKTNRDNSKARSDEELEQDLDRQLLAHINHHKF